MKNKKLLFDTFWSLGGHFSSLFIVLITNLLLARFMTPEEFGQLAIVMFFVSVFNIFTDGGMGGALVRKLDKNEDDYKTVFTFNFILSILFFLLIVIIANPIAQFYNNLSLRGPIIFSGIILIITSFQTIQNIKLVTELKFKRKSALTLISTFLSSIIGVLFAYYLKLGLWALICIPVLSAIIQTILFIYYEGFYFKIGINKKSFKELFSFGINTTLVSTLNLTFDNIYQLVLGRVFSLNQVGFYYQAKKLQDVPNNLVNNLSQGVFYSTLSKLQEDTEQLKNTYNLISTIVIWFMGLGVLVILLFSEELINLLLGHKWTGSVFYIKLLVIGSFFYSQELINKMIFKIFNKTKILLKLEVVKKLIQIFTLIIGIYFKRIDLLLYGYILTSVLSYFLNYYSTNKLLKFSNKEMILLFKVVFIVLTLYYFFNQFMNVNFHFLFNSIIIILLYIILSYLLKVIDIKQLINRLKF